MLGLGLGLVASSAILTEGAVRCGAFGLFFAATAGEFFALLQNNFLCPQKMHAAPLLHARYSVLWPALAAHITLAWLG